MQGAHDKGVRFVDPHEIGHHAAACKGRAGCILGIDISHARPFLLDTPEKVKAANRIKKQIGGRLLTRRDWKLGEHCWYRPKK